MATPVPLSEIVSVSIVAQEAIQSSAGFEKPLILDEQNVYGGTGRVLTIGSLAEMTAAGYSTYHKAYRLAQLMLTQSPRPKQIKIGQWDKGGAETIATAWAAIIAEDPEFYWVVSTSRVEADILALAAEVEASSNPYYYYAETSDADVVDNNPGNVALDLKNLSYTRCRALYKAATAQVIQMKVNGQVTAGTFTGSIDGNALSVPFNTDHDTTIGDLATAIAATAGGTSATASSSGDLGALDDVITITSVDAFVLNLLVITTDYTGGAFTQTVTISASAPLAACLVGALAPFLPGARIEAFQRLKGVAADSLTSAQRTNLVTLNAGFYIQYGQIASMGGGSDYGKSAGGSIYADLQILIDWLTLAIQAAVMTRLQVSSGRVPYTTAGIEEVKQAIRGPLAEGVQREVIQPSGDTDDGDLGTIGYTVGAPALSDISDANKAARHLPGVTFQARASGAIQSVTISGVLTF